MKHKIIFGDCRRALEKLPAKSVHLIITSPPYNIAIGNGNGNWTDKMPFNQYLELTEKWLKECYRVLADGGKICVNLPFNDRNNIAFLHHKLMNEIGFTFKANIAWIKWDWQRKDKFAVSKWKIQKYNPSKYNPILINAYEIIIVMQKGYSKFKCKQDLTDEEFNKWGYNVWLIPPIKQRTHPAPYPLELARRLIKLYSCPGHTILDPFLGSGTTTKAALELNRNSIGIELDPEYIQMAKDNIRYKYLSVENL